MQAQDILTSVPPLLYFAAAFGVVFVLLPMIVLGHQPDMTRFERFWCAAVLGTTHWTALCLILAPFRFHDLAGLVVSSLVLVTLYLMLIRHQNVREAWSRLYHRTIGMFMDLLDEGHSVFVRDQGLLGKRRGAASPAAGTFDYPRWLIWGVFLYAAYLRLYDSVTHYSFSFFDPYVHIVWLKMFNQGDVFYDGVYPRGYHAALSVVGTFSGLDPYFIIRYAGGLVGALLPVAIFFLLLQCRLSWSAALVGASLMAVCSPFHSQMERQTASLPQEYAIVFMLVTLGFCVRYLRFGYVRDGWAVLGGTFVVWAAHSLVGAALFVGQAVLAIDYLAHNQASTTRFLGLVRDVFIGGVAGNLFLFIGHVVLGHPYHAHSMELLGAGFGEAVPATSSGTALEAFTRTGLSDNLGIVITVLALCGIPMILFGLARRREPFPSPAFLSLWAFIFFLMWSLKLGTGIYTLFPEDRSQTFLSVAAGGVAALILALVIEPLLGRWSTNVASRAVLASATIACLIFWFYTPPPAPEHWQYEEAAWLYTDLVSDLPRGSWTVVGQAEDYQLALNEGYHMNVSKFLSDYPPRGEHPPFPTPYVFIILEKVPMKQPESVKENERVAEEHLLADWVRIYSVAHPGDLRTYRDTKDVGIYLLYHPEVEKTAQPGSPG